MASEAFHRESQTTCLWLTSHNFRQTTAEPPDMFPSCLSTSKLWFKKVPSISKQFLLHVISLSYLSKPWPTF